MSACDASCSDSGRLVFACCPTHDPDRIAEGIARIMRPGPLDHAGLDAAIRRLHACHDAWLASYPLGLWGRGLAVTGDMRLFTDTYLPVAEIRTGFRQLYRAALLVHPVLSSCPVHRAASWLDLLPLFDRAMVTTSPAELLRRAADDGVFRCRLLLGMFLPRHYGCGFGRYGRQLAFIRQWLVKNRKRFQAGIRCLDAACGTGEGAYDLAHLLLHAGYPPEQCTVHGSTREPFELFAGAFGHFPHDPGREALYRVATRELTSAGVTSRMAFMLGDVTDEPGDGGSYDLVVCNGLLGGPLLHGERELERAVAVLAGRLSPGGMVCIADRFHAGWKRTSTAAVVTALRQHGLELIPLPDGVAAGRCLR